MSVGGTQNQGRYTYETDIKIGEQNWPKFHNYYWAINRTILYFSQLFLNGTLNKWFEIYTLPVFEKEKHYHFS